MKPFIHASLWISILLFSLQKSGNAQPLTALGPTTFCQGNSVVLSVPLDSATSYVWLQDSTLISGQQGNQLIVTNTGNYRVIRSSVANCCDTSNSIFVQVNPLPIATINPSGTVTVYCGPNVPTLTTTPTPGATYQWFKDNVAIAGATSTSYLPYSVGVYYVLVTLNNCQQASPTLTIVGGAPPSGSTNLTSTSVQCSGQATLQITPFPGALSYRWYRDFTLIATTQNTYSMVVTQSGSYHVEVAWHPVCMPLTSNSLQVYISSRPSTTISAIGATQICNGDSVTLNSGGGYYFVSWYRDGVLTGGGIGANSIRVGRPGNYHCTFYLGSPQSNPNQCQGNSTNTIQVTQATQPLAPTLNLLGNTIFSSLGGNFKWFRNGILLSGVNDSFLVLTQSGLYNAMRSEAGCYSDTSNTIHFSSVGIASISENSWNVYPNPSSGIFNITLSALDNSLISLRVYTVHGAIVHETEVVADDHKSKIELDLSPLPQGVYLLEMRSGSSQAHQRLVLSR